MLKDARRIIGAFSLAAFSLLLIIFVNNTLVKIFGGLGLDRSVLMLLKSYVGIDDKTYRLIQYVTSIVMFLIIILS